MNHSVTSPSFRILPQNLLKGQDFRNCRHFSKVSRKEEIKAEHRRTREAIEDITEYIEIFYNRQRLQAGLGYLSPVAYAQKYYTRLLAV